MSFKSRLSACAALIAIAPIAPAVAQDAQPEARTTDVITVTTQFREQSLADVPINVAAFDEEMIEQLDIPDICERVGMTRDAVYAWRSRLSKLARQIRAELSDPKGPARTPVRGAT